MATCWGARRLGQWVARMEVEQGQRQKGGGSSHSLSFISRLMIRSTDDVIPHSQQSYGVEGVGSADGIEATVVTVSRAITIAIHSFHARHPFRTDTSASSRDCPSHFPITHLEWSSVDRRVFVEGCHGDMIIIRSFFFAVFRASRSEVQRW